MALSRFARLLQAAALFATAVAGAGCAGGGAQGVLMPSGGGLSGAGGAGNTVVRIFIPLGAAAPGKPFGPPPTPLPVGALPGTTTVQTPATPPVSTPAPAPGSQSLSINVSGPTTISQTISVGPNSSGCTPAAGGSNCQLALTLPAGVYTGTIGSAAIAFTVASGTNNTLNLTMGGVPSQIAVVPASYTSAQGQQGVIDLYGAGRHPLLVEMLDANSNVMVGGAGSNFSLSQAGGALSVSVAPAAAVAPNLFYVTTSTAPSGGFAILHVAANSKGPGNPCMQSNAVCSGTVRVDVRQILAVANSSAGSVSLYVAGQTTPLATIQAGLMNPQTLVFDPAGDLFVANQPGSVSEFVPPYNQAPVTIAGGVNHPQSLAVDARGDLFVANGNGSNTVTIYAPPYTGTPTITIASNVNDPVSLALDGAADLFVVNAAANTVAEYAPPYTGAPTIVSRGLNTPSSLALDARGNLFVANLNSTPNSVVEYAPPFSDASTPIATITNGVNEQGSISLVSSNLFVPNQGANTVTEYTAPYTNAPTTIAGGQSQPLALAVDSAGNLYVANYGNNTVTIYSSPYAPGSWSTIATGIGAPLALALSPATAGGPTLLP